MIHISQLNSKPNSFEYYRKPTKEEVKFGYGALHYRDFDFEKCFDAENNLKLKIRASDDKLIYYYGCIEHFTASKAKLNKIEI